MGQQQKEGPARELQNKLQSDLATPTQPHVPLPMCPPVLEQISKLDEIAIQDAVRRLEGLVQLIYHTDRKAVQLKGIYFAIIGFVSTVSIANLRSAGVWSVVAAFSIVLILSCGVHFAYRTQVTTRIFLSGMKPDFWQWARAYEISPRDVVSLYLERTADALAKNEDVNTRAARCLTKAYLCGRFALFAGVACFAFFLFQANACPLPGVWGAGLVCRL